MPEITLPLGQNAAGDRQWLSTVRMIPFRQDRLREIYGSREIYLERYSAAAERLSAASLILPERAAIMKASIAEAVSAF